MTKTQTEVIFLNLLRQTDEFILSIVGTNPEGDAGSFRKRVSTLFESFLTDKAGFVASSESLGFLATLLTEYAAFRLTPIESIGTPEILLTVPRWNDIYDKPDTFPPALHDHDLSVLPETVKIGNTYVLGNVAGSLLLSEDGLSGYEVSTEGHLHNSEMAGMTVLFPDNQDPPYWERCDGRAISRTTPQGENLVNLSCPFGVGDGTTTVNLPTLTAPSGFAYYMFIGYA